MWNIPGAAGDAVIGVGTAIVGLQPEGAIYSSTAHAGILIDRTKEPRQLIAQVEHAIRAIAKDFLCGLDGNVINPNQGMFRLRSCTLCRLGKRPPLRHGGVVCLPQLIIDAVEWPRCLIEDRCLHCAWVANECDPQPRRFGPVAVAFDVKLNAIGNSCRAYS